jgi:hypothetical protein
MLENVCANIYRTTDEPRYYVARCQDGWDVMRENGITVGVATRIEAVVDIIEEDRNGRRQ